MRSCPELAHCAHTGIGTSSGRTLFLVFKTISIFFMHIFQHCKPTTLIRETIPVVSQCKVNVSRLEKSFCSCSCLSYLHPEASSSCPLISAWGKYNCTQNLASGLLSKSPDFLKGFIPPTTRKCPNKTVSPLWMCKEVHGQHRTSFCKNGSHCGNPKITEPAIYVCIATLVTKLCLVQ